MRRLLAAEVGNVSGEAMNVLGRSKGIALLAPHSADEKSTSTSTSTGEYEGGGGERGGRAGESGGGGGDGGAVDYVVERLRCGGKPGGGRGETRERPSPFL